MSLQGLYTVSFAVVLIAIQLACTVLCRKTVSTFTASKLDNIIGFLLEGEKKVWPEWIIHLYKCPRRLSLDFLHL